MLDALLALSIGKAQKKFSFNQVGRLMPGGTLFLPQFSFLYSAALKAYLQATSRAAANWKTAVSSYALET
jgi:hypothetical protein